MAPVTAPPAAPAPAPWVPSRKLIAAVVTNVLTLIAALVVTRLGLHESPMVAGEVSAGIGIVAGGTAGYLVREIPKLESEVKDAPTKM